MVELLLVLVKPIYPPIYFILVQTGMMGGFVHIGVITYNPPYFYLKVGIIQLMCLVIFHSVFLMFKVKVVWVLVPPTFHPGKFIGGLMMVIFCHLGVVIIHQ